MKKNKNNLLSYRNIGLGILLALFLFSFTGVNAKEGEQRAKISTISLGGFFSLIEKETPFVVIFDRNEVDVDQKVKYNQTLKPFEKVIEQVLSKRHDIEYKLYKKQIIISKKQQSATSKVKANQKIQVKGIVKSSDGEPLIGVSVAEKRTGNGTISDIDGAFRLSVSPNSILLFSYVGFLAQEVKVSNQSTLNIVLEPNISELEEVVVIGYGVKSAKTLTGSVSVISQDVIKGQTNTSVVSALQGALPGVNVTRSGGQPGNEGYSFNIRGISSINSSSPLIIIDGIPGSFEQLDLINPSDIKDITVLKDAAASIYGARAAGGVMLVTTKLGAKKSHLKLNTRFSVKTPSAVAKRVSTTQHFEMAEEAHRNDGIPNNVFSKYIGLPLDGSWVEGPFPDTPNLRLIDNEWSDIIWGKAVSHQYDLSYSGSTEKSKFSISAGYLKDEGMVNYGINNSERYNARLNYEFKVGERLTIAPIVALTYKKTETPINIGKAFNPLTYPYSSVPKYADNGLPFDFGGFKSLIGYLEHGGDRLDDKLNINSNIRINYKFFDDLTFTGQAGLNYTNNYADEYSRRYLGAINAAGDRVNRHPNTQGRNYTSKIDDRGVYSNLTGHFNYKKSFAGGDHKVGLMVGGSKETSYSENFRAWRFNTVSDELFHISTGDIGEQFNNGSITEWALASVFGRFDYSYKDRYYFEMQYRADGSSRFIKDSRWESFDSYLFGWTITNESFMEQQNVLDFLKVRASYGTSGNQSGIGLYDYVTRISNAGSYPFGIEGVQTQAYRAGAMTSLDRTWERVKIQNIGIDFRTLNNRLYGTFDYFKKVNENMLIPIVYPTILGARAPRTNSGELEVYGFELTLGWKDEIGDFSYFIEGNLSDSKNKLVDLAGADSYNIGTVQAREGYALNTVFGFESDGFITTQEELDEYKSMEGVLQTLRIGDIKYKDLDGDGKISPFGENGGDVKVLGDWSNRYLFGVRLGGKYKNFDFSCFFQGVGKRMTILNSELRPMEKWYRQPSEIMYHNTWHEDRQEGVKYPKMSTNRGISWWNYRTSDNTVETYSYVRLKNLQIGYNLNSNETLRKLGISSLRVYLTGNDLWENSSLPEGFDPEVGLSFSHPFARYFGGGIDLKF